MSDRTLPHSLDAERAALGAAMMSASAWSEMSIRVRAEDFFRSAHARIYAAMASLSEANVVIDALTVVERLRTSGELDEVGGPAYVTGLTDGIPSSLNVAHYAEIVREKSRLRQIVAAASDMEAAAYDGAQASSVLIDRSIHQLANLIDADTAGARVAHATVEAYLETLSQSSDQILKTGIIDLDNLIGGVRRECLTILAARPSTGKSSLALGIADNVTQRRDAALFFSLEMSERQLAGRLVAWRSGVSAIDVERGHASDQDYTRVVSSVVEFEDTPLHIVTSARTLSDMHAWCRRIAPRVVVVDYLQLIDVESRSDNQEAKIATISKGLKRLALDRDVCVIALSQLGRAPEKRRDKRPHASDLRGSGALEQDADLVLLLYREDMYKPTEDNEGMVELIIAKHRDGPTGLIRLHFDKRLARFRDLARYED